MELSRFLKLVYKRLGFIVLGTLLVTGITYWLSASSPPVFEASATLFVEQPVDPRGDPYGALAASQQSARSYVLLVTQPSVMEDVIKELGLKMSTSQLAGKVRAAQVQNSQLVQVIAEDSNPALTQALANKTAEVFARQIAKTSQTKFEEAKGDLDRQIASLEKEIDKNQAALAALGDPPDTRNRDLPAFARIERSRLESNLLRAQTLYTILVKSAEDFRLAAARYGNPITVSARADLPRFPVRPNVPLTTLLGFLAGLGASILMAGAIEYLEDSVDTPEEIERLTRAPILADIGVLPESKDGGYRLIALDTKAQAAEGFRGLRTNVEFSMGERPRYALLITSSVPSEGKTFVACNLAIVMAQAGKSVILTDCDLRHPGTHKAFGISREVGLTTVLMGKATLLDALRPTEVQGLRLLPSGPLPPNPSEILSSDSMRKTLAALKEAADVVILDSPPVLPVTDPSVLASLADGILLVVDVTSAKRATLTHTCEDLTKVNGHMTGVVVNKIAPQGGYGYYGRYRYYYRYYYRYSNSSDGHRDQHQRRGIFANTLGRLFSSRRRGTRSR
ncbi:MAG: polysaccharide biosynthesis tyrosine autokinase [Chloroflexi bacterium]|nr:polysaccharide biosynthesis tyrosine autokinase [Chloroflexota bacterium]